jgi:hypothetical protein
MPFKFCEITAPVPEVLAKIVAVQIHIGVADMLEKVLKVSGDSVLHGRNKTILPREKLVTSDLSSFWHLLVNN